MIAAMGDIDVDYLLVRLLQLVFPALWVACAITAILKLRPRVAGVFTGVGCGLISMLRFLDFIPWHEWGYSRFAFASFFALVNFGGMALVLTGLLCVHREANLTAFASAAPFGGANATAQPPRCRPGWGLVVTWIVLSAASWVLGIAMLALVIEAGSHINDDEMAALVAVGVLNFLAAIPTAVVFFIWLYGAWDAVPPQYRGTSPGRAVGFLFIPFFNFYWVFRAIPGLSASIKRARRALAGGCAGGAGFGIGIAVCVIGIIPYVGILAWPFLLIWMILANMGKNRMLGEQQSAFACGQGVQAPPASAGI
jgi:hypothetical protein